MCGLAGILSFRGALPEQTDARLRASADALRHRGPDDQGFYREGEIGLAFRRLSILDLAGGHQPMSNESGTVQVIFNGEIYNYREITRTLEERGHRFRTRSDTEAIVHLYEEAGEDFVHQLRGMFAIAIWDSRSRKLILVRDRLGIKPLFYRSTSQELVFASELKGILSTLPLSVRRLDEESLARYFRFLYLPGDRSIFAGIHKLRPAHLMICQDGKVSIRRYWNLPPVDPAPGFDRAEAVERLRALLEESVRLRLISDVPLGAFLSGGIDSSCVVALMKKVSKDPVKTFTIGFEEEEFNEIPIARKVAKALGTEHCDLVVRPEAIGLVEKVISAFDEPFGDPSAIPTYLVSRLARAQVTVALSGDGGDELFAGYNRYQSLTRLDSLRRLPRGMRRAGSFLLGKVGAASFSATRLSGALRRSLDVFPQDYIDSVNFLFDRRAAAAVTPAWREAAAKVGWEVSVDGWSDPVDGAQRIDLHNYLPEDILAKVDRMSMACSLEGRVPLLDHRVVEFVACLPPAWKRESRPKSLLLEAAGHDLPHETWNRPKRGFGIPLSHWFRNELRDYLKDLFLGETARRRGFWDRRGMESLISAHQQGAWDFSEQLWAFLTLELWHRKYLDPANPYPGFSDSLPPVLDADAGQVPIRSVP
ncbi:MAG TPA: asparagine synthase (glutamine-hydrolyzing) [Candidatus Polarisedimenticolia bacterium]|nr:asparagine synthase (glutamine-hydrolyzing) [Candidatus Polarisedimenticolia bacterium]